MKRSPLDRSGVHLRDVTPRRSAVFVILAWLLSRSGCVGGGEPPPANLVAFGYASLVTGTPDGHRLNVAFLAREDNQTEVTWGAEARLYLEWQHPRPVRAVQLKFAGEPPSPDTLRLEWWRRIWPDNGTGGWMRLDDPFHGEWTVARTRVVQEGDRLTAHLQPLETSEAPGVQNPGFGFRETYKLRISSPASAKVTQVAAWSDAVLRRARLRFEWGVRTSVPGEWNPRFEARNARLLGEPRASGNTAVVEVEYADAAARLSPERGFVAFRSGPTRSFSVFVDDVLREGGIFVRDLGVFVSDADRNLTSRDWTGPAGDVWRTGTVEETVARLPEQSFEQARAAMPAKPPRYAFLGAPNLRQEIALEPRGDIVLHADSLRSPGRDAAVAAWRRWETLRYQFGTGEHPVMGSGDRRLVHRELEEGWLPVIRHTWSEDDFDWEQTSVAGPLAGQMEEFRAETGTEPLVLATRFQVRNSGSTRRVAWLWCELNHPLPLYIGANGTLLLRRPSLGPNRAGLIPVRGAFQTRGRGDLDLGILVPGAPGSPNDELRASASPREALRYRVELAPGEVHACEFFVPYIESLDTAEAAALAALSFESMHRSVVAFWKSRVAEGMTLETPEPWLNNLFRANLWHVLISTDIDPVTRQHQHGAATHGYKNFLNETMMVARSLEMRGERGAARRLIETFLANQGARELPGNFRSSLGVLYAAHPGEPDPYTAQGYNMHHGWGLAAAAQHFAWSRDSAWLVAVAPRLIAAADWITRERQATRFLLPDGSRPIEFGLQPAGDLEDVEEYLYWYATAAYYHLGIQSTADVLATAARAGQQDGGSTSADFWRRLDREADRLASDAAAFRADIQASVAESVATSPVVQLRDGSWIPYVPPRAYALTHRKEGWIREALYPALHLVNGGVYAPDHPFVDWMIQELEDNLFLSAESGYGLAKPRTQFFDQGGFTLQPNLLDLALVYLERDQPANFLRAFYNTAAASLYPDTMCFAEWVPRLGEGGGPLYKTPDECKFIQWLRQLLILERGNELELGLGIPRAWMRDGQRLNVERAATHFGTLSLNLVSRISAGHVEATVRLLPTQTPKALRLRIRHPDGSPLRSAEVNGRGARINAERQMIELPPDATSWEVIARFQ